MAEVENTKMGRFVKRKGGVGLIFLQENKYALFLLEAAEDSTLEYIEKNSPVLNISVLFKVIQYLLLIEV